MRPRQPTRVLVPLVVAAPALLLPTDSPGRADPPPRTVAEAGQQLRARPAAFVPNLGQWQHTAAYVARIGPMTVFLAEKGWTFTLEDRSDQESKRGVAVRMSFENAGTTQLLAEGRLPGLHHYFLGHDPTRWRSDVPRYRAVRYRDTHPGIDVRAREHDGHFEFDLVLAPGAEVEPVEIRVEGIERMRLDGDGALVLETALGPVRMPAPPSWEEGPSGEKSPIACRYVLLGEDRFGFETSRRRPGWALTVDPGLVWSTFLGAAGVDEAHALAVDARGAVTVAGMTQAPNFPTTPGAFDTTYNGNGDVFVTRLTPSCTLVYSTFLGGTSIQGDSAEALAVDAQGAATIGGRTGSADFPTTTKALDTTYNGGIDDAFLARLSPSGASLVYSTFLGGTAQFAGEGVRALAVQQGVATVAGITRSANFPTTPGAFDTTHNGNVDAFVARLDPSKTGRAQLVWSTLLGEAREDGASAVAVDAKGATTVAGWTFSPKFPTTAGAFDRAYSGGEAFVARLSSTGSSLVWSTFLGGTKAEGVRALVLDGQGFATVAGNTNSTNFPTTPSAFDTTYNGGIQDTFVARLSPSGASLVYATFLGGTGREIAHALALDAQSAATVVGLTDSTDFPTTPGSFDTTHNGKEDAFMVRLAPSGSALVYSTFLGGTLWDAARAVALDGQRGATVAGWTYSANYPRTCGAFVGGPTDAFVTRLDMLPTGVVRFGQSTPACRGPIAMGVTRMPQSGDPQFAVTCGSAPTVSAGVLLLGAGQDASGLPILGIRVHVDLRKPLILLPAATSTIGAAESPLPIPPGTKGARFFLQYAWANTVTCGGPGTFSASDALDVTVQ